MTDTTPEDVLIDRGEAAPAERPASTADLARAADEGGTAALARAAEPQPVAATPEAPAEEPLFPGHEAEALRAEWSKVQAGFVDEPRKAVEDADALVASSMKKLAETFASARSELEGQWDRGDQISTEDLRLAFQRYRAFFTRLLSI